MIYKSMLYLADSYWIMQAWQEWYTNLWLGTSIVTSVSKRNSRQRTEVDSLPICCTMKLCDGQVQSAMQISSLATFCLHYIVHYKKKWIVLIHFGWFHPIFHMIVINKAFFTNDLKNQIKVLMCLESKADSGTPLCLMMQTCNYRPVARIF